MILDELKPTPNPSREGNNSSNTNPMLVKENRLRLKNDFKRVFKKGKFCQEEFLAIKIAPNDSETSRFGFIVSKKISKKAVVRNKIKRRLRESVRLKLKDGLIKNGFDAVVITRPRIVDKSFFEIDGAVGKLLEKAGVLK